MAEDYCDLCDLPKSQCVHGQSPLPPKVVAEKVAKPKPVREVPTKPRATSRAAPPPTVSRRTGQEVFRPHILQILREYGGRLEAEDLLVELESRLSDVLLERDREISPQGEVRWRTVARAERRAMMDEGLVVAAQPGVWELTEKGLA